MSQRSLSEAKENLRTTARRLSISRAVRKEPLQSTAKAAAAGAAAALIDGSKLSFFTMIKNTINLSSKAIKFSEHFMKGRTNR